MISVVPSTEPDSGTDEPIPSDRTFEATAKASAEWGMQHEVQIKALEVCVSQFTISFYLPVRLRGIEWFFSLRSVNDQIQFRFIYNLRVINVGACDSKLCSVPVCTLLLL